MPDSKGDSPSVREMVWCETCKCEHIVTVPADTWQCVDCGFGQWGDEAALYHARKHVGHRVFVVNHQMREARAPSQNLRGLPATMLVVDEWSE